MFSKIVSQSIKTKTTNLTWHPKVTWVFLKKYEQYTDQRIFYYCMTPDSAFWFHGNIINYVKNTQGLFTIFFFSFGTNSYIEKHFLVTASMAKIGRVLHISDLWPFLGVAEILQSTPTKNGLNLSSKYDLFHFTCFHNKNDQRPNNWLRNQFQ